MTLDELAYIVIGTTKLDEWHRFAERMMGAVVERSDDGSLYVQLDEWHYRILIVPHPEETYLHAGWGVIDAAAYETALAEIRGHGCPVEIGTRDECDLRLVAALFRFRDPGGNSHEVCWGRTMTSKIFVSPVGVSGFVTGDLGMGHVVLPCHGDFDATLDFCQRVMGLSYSDYFARRTTPDGPLRRAYFMHCNNARQHSLALVEIEEPSGLLHYLTEVATLDDVGRALDRVRELGVPLARSLGRHVNDSIVSFYVVTPSGFHMEYGYGGDRMDWTGHQVRQISNGTYWGHEWQPGIFVVAPKASAPADTARARDEIEARKTIPT